MKDNIYINNWNYLCKRFVNKNLNNFLLLSGNINQILPFSKNFSQLLLCQKKKYDVSCNNCLSCNLLSNNFHPDILITTINTSSTKEVFQRIITFLHTKPTIGKRRVVIINNISNSNSQNIFYDMLLKPLEEISKNYYFFLLTENFKKIKKTLISRSCIIRFKILLNDLHKTHETYEKIVYNIWNKKKNIIEQLLLEKNYSLAKKIFYMHDNEMKIQKKFFSTKNANLSLLKDTILC